MSDDVIRCGTCGVLLADDHSSALFLRTYDSPEPEFFCSWDCVREGETAE